MTCWKIAGVVRIRTLFVRVSAFLPGFTRAEREWQHLPTGLLRTLPNPQPLIKYRARLHITYLVPGTWYYDILDCLYTRVESAVGYELK